MIAYFHCICRSSDKLLAKQLKEQGYEIRDIRVNSEWRREAKSYNLAMPFVVENGTARSL